MEMKEEMLKLFYLKIKAEVFQLAIKIFQTKIIDLIDDIKKIRGEISLVKNFKIR